MESFITILAIIFGSMSLSVLGGIWLIFNSKAWKGKSLNREQQKVVKQLEAESKVLRERVETLEHVLHSLGTAPPLGEKKRG
jgi:hypothetical protein